MKNIKNFISSNITWDDNRNYEHKIKKTNNQLNLSHQIFFLADLLSEDLKINEKDLVASKFWKEKYFNSLFIKALNYKSNNYNSNHYSNNYKYKSSNKFLINKRKLLYSYLNIFSTNNFYFYFVYFKKILFISDNGFSKSLDTFLAYIDYSFFDNSALLFSSIDIKESYEQLLKILPYLCKQDLKRKDITSNKTAWHYVLDSVCNQYRIEIIRNILPLLDKEDLKEKCNELKNCWHYLLYFVKSEYPVEVLKLLLPYLDKVDLDQANKSDETCWIYLFYSSISGEHQVNALKLLMPYLEYKDISKRMTLYNQTCLHYLLLHVNVYTIETVKLLLEKNLVTTELMHLPDQYLRNCWNYILRNINKERAELIYLLYPFMTESTMNTLTLDKYTCWFDLTVYIENQYAVEIFEFLLPKLDKKILKVFDVQKRTLWHHILYEINNEYQVKIIKLLLPYLDAKDLWTEELHYHQTCWHYLFRNINNTYQVEIIRLLISYLDKDSLRKCVDYKNQLALTSLFCNIDNQYKVEIIKLILPSLDFQTFQNIRLIDDTFLDNVHDDYKAEVNFLLSPYL